MLPLEDKVAGVMPVSARAGLVGETVDDATRDKIRKVVQACGDRLKVYTDIFLYGSFFFQDPVYDPDAVKKRLKKDGAMDLLREAAGLLETMPAFDHSELESRIKDFCERKNKSSLATSIMCCGWPITGVMIGPGVFEILAILGKEESLKRIAKGDFVMSSDSSFRAHGAAVGFFLVPGMRTRNGKSDHGDFDDKEGIPTLRSRQRDRRYLRRGRRTPISPALGFERGTMRLVDLPDQKTLLKRFHEREPRLVSGGSVANSVIAFSQLGGQARLSSAASATIATGFSTPRNSKSSPSTSATPSSSARRPAPAWH